MTSPQISIIVPVYQVEKYLRDCLEHLIHQTYSNIEIICVDDGCTDNSPAILQEYADRDARIRIVRQKNGGLSAARNSGMKVATAPFLMFCDSDDYYELDMCEKMLAAIQNAPEADLAMCGMQIFFEDELGKNISDNYHDWYQLKFEGYVPICAKLLKNCTAYVWNKIYRRDFLEKYEITFPEGVNFEDRWFFYVCAVHARGIYFIKDTLYHYRRRKGSIMSDTYAKKNYVSIDQFRIAIRLWYYYKKHNVLHKWGEYIVDFWRQNLRMSLRYEKTAEARKKITGMVRDFIRNEKLGSNNMPRDIVGALNSILRKDDKKLTQRICGPIDRRLTCRKKTIRLFKIPMFGISYTHSSITTRVFGIPVWRTSFKPTHFTPIDNDNTILLKTLREIGSFTYIPNPGNMGDLLLAASTLKFLDEHGLPYRMYKEGEFPDTIVYGGGGAWTANYEKWWKNFLPIFAKSKRVVILPSSFHDCEHLWEAVDERFTIFCREPLSYKYACQQATRARVILDHDMALRMPASIFNERIPSKVQDSHRACDVLYDLAYLPESDIAYFLRKDMESNGKADMPGIDLSSYGYGSQNSPREKFMYFAQFMLTIVDFYKVIVTDRLHVAISGALMGKKVYILDNSYKKCSSVYLHSLQHLPNIQLVEELPLHEDLEKEAQMVPEGHNVSFFRRMKSHYTYYKQKIIKECLKKLFMKSTVMKLG